MAGMRTWGVAMLSTDSFADAYRKRRCRGVLWKDLSPGISLLTRVWVDLVIWLTFLR